MKYDKTGVIVAAIALASLFCNVAVSQEVSPDNTQASGLKLTCGTLQAGGVITVKTEIVLPEDGGSTSGFWASLVPDLGYFFMDNFELIAGVNFGTGVGDLYANSRVSVGFDLGVRYIFGPGPLIYPYVGASYGMDFIFNEIEDDTQAMRIAVPAGILIAVNYNVAIDLGIRFLFSKRLEEGANSYIEIPVGYFGVQAFI